MTNESDSTSLLKAIIYTSFGPSLKMDDLVQIAETSFDNNAKIAVTGMLAFAPKQHKIIQLLEGKKKQLDSLMEKIGNDPRHCQVQIIYNQPILKRSFAEWSMGLKEVLEIPPLVTDGIALKNLGSFEGKVADGVIRQSRPIRIFKAFLDEYS